MARKAARNMSETPQGPAVTVRRHVRFNASGQNGPSFRLFQMC
jgi:hypothetical protein